MDELLMTLDDVERVWVLTSQQQMSLNVEFGVVTRALRMTKSELADAA